MRSCALRFDRFGSFTNRLRTALTLNGGLMTTIEEARLVHGNQQPCDSGNDRCTSSQKAR